MKEIKIYKSPWKAIKIMLLCSIFVVPSILILLRSSDSPWQLWLSIGFFGLGYPLGIVQLLDRRPQIIINELGIFDRTTHHSFINWEIIQDAYLVEMHKQPFICLVVDEAFEPSRTKGRFGRRMAQLSKEMGFQELNIALGSVTLKAERLADFILAMRAAEKPARVFLVEKAIDNF
ncbi:MAG: hypothetical protein EOO55_03400 [Hymenobacter sp.]|nr:MAG: hypothetical protein EOO55_03400 [Hymenobacter sp.]